MKLVVAAIAVSLTSGCALTSRGKALTFSYYTPERPRTTLTSAEQAATPRPAAPEVVLGRVSAGTHLGIRIVHRDGAHQLGFYEDRRWSEHPETYVRHALTRTLFEEHRFQRVVSGVAPQLDVEVLSFEELRYTKPHQGRVSLRVVVTGPRDVLLEETITVDRPIAEPGDTAATAAAIGEALDAAVEIVAERLARVAPAAPARDAAG